MLFKMNRRQRNKMNNIINLLIIAILEQEEGISVIKEKRLWIREWINRRDRIGDMNSFLKEMRKL